MNTHPYLRAFLAGAFVPTIALPFALMAFIVFRLVLQVPLPIERGLIFPMSLIPSLWALWNMLWVGTHTRTHLPLGLHGALLPFLLLPGGAALATCLRILTIDPHGVTWFLVVHLPFTFVGPAFACALAGYYLVWKYVVGFLNRVLGIE